MSFRLKNVVFRIIAREEFRLLLRLAFQGVVLELLAAGAWKHDALFDAEDALLVRGETAKLTVGAAWRNALVIYLCHGLTSFSLK